MFKPLPALVLVGLFALVACGDDSASPAGSGGGTSTVSVSVSVSSAAATTSSTSTATGSGGESTSGGDGGAGGGTGPGTGGQGGQGGEGGAPGTGGSGQGGSSTTSGDPIDCVVCIATECPQIAECIADPACRDGLVCTLTGCIVDGQPDLVCIADCFGGDFAAALDAVEALACVVTTCGEGCGGLIPAG